MSKDTKKFLSFVLVLCLIFTQFVGAKMPAINVYAGETALDPIDFTQYGIKVGGSDTKAADYKGDGSGVGEVNGFRMNAASNTTLLIYWGADYLKYVNIGEMDMSQVKGVSFKYAVQDLSSDTVKCLSNKVYLAKRIAEGEGPECFETLAYGMIEDFSSHKQGSSPNLMGSNPGQVEMTVLDKTYKGEVYFCFMAGVDKDDNKLSMEGTDGITIKRSRCRVSDVVITIDDTPAVTEAPATEAPATEAPATEAPATEVPATEAPVTPTPAVTPSANLKESLGGYIFTKDVIVGTHFSIGSSLVKAQSGGGSGDAIYLTPRTGRGSDSYATITLQDADAVKGLNVNTYSKLVVKIQLSREFVDGESKSFAVSINGGEARSAELVSTTAGQFIVIDLAGAGADSLGTIKPSFGTGMTDYQKYTIEYFAFFAANADLSSFDGDLDALLASGETPTPTPEATPEITPTPTPEATPEITPTPTPEVTPEITPTPAVTPSANLKESLGGYIFTKDVIVGTHFSIGSSLVKAQSGGGSGDAIYLTPRTGRGSDSYATITLQDADAVKGLNVNTYSKLVVKIQLSREFVDGESKSFAVSINGGEARSAELVSTTAGQFIVIDLAGAGADSLGTIKPSFGTGMTDYQKYTIEYFAFFAANADLSSFDGDLDALLASGETPTPTPEATPEITPTPTPEATPEITPTPTPEVTPEITPEPTTPAPEYASKEALDKAVADLDALIKANKADIDTINASITNINNILAALNAESRISAAEAAITKLLNDTVPALNALITDNSKNISGNASDIADLKATIASIQTTLGNLEAEDQKLAGLIEALDTKFSTLSSSVVALEASIKEIQSKLDNAIASLDTLIKTGGTIDEINAAIKSINDALTALNGENRISAAEAAIEKLLTETIPGLNASIAANNSNITGNLSAIAALDAAIADIQETLGTLKTEDENLAGLISGLGVRLDTFSATLAALKDKVAAVEKEIANLEAALDAKVEELKNADTANADAIAGLISEINGIKDLIDSIGEGGSVNEALWKQAVAEINAKLAEIEQDIADAVAKLEAADQTNANAIATEIARIEKLIAAAEAAAKVAAEAADATVKADLEANIAAAEATINAKITAIEKTLSDAISKLESADTANADAIAGLISEINGIKDLIDNIGEGGSVNEALWKQAVAEINAKLAEIEQDIADAIAKLEAADKANADAVAAEIARIEKLIAAAEAAAKAAAEVADATVKAELEAKIAKAEEAINAKIAAIEKALSDAIAKLEAADKANADAVAAEIARIEKLIAAAEAAAKAADASVKSDLEAEITKAENAINESINALQKNLDDAVASLEALIKANKADIDAIKDAINTINETLKALDVIDGRFNEIENILKNLIDNTIPGLSDLISANSAKIDGNIKDIAELAAEIADIRTTLASLTAQDAEMAATISELSAKLSTLSQDIITLADRVSVTEKDIADIKARLDEIITALEKADVTNADAIAEAVKEINAIKEVIAALSTKDVDLENAYQAADKAISDKIDEIKVAIESEIAKIKEAQSKDAETLTSEIARLEALIEAANAAATAADATIKAELEAQIANAQTTLDAAIKQVQANLDKVKTDLEKAIADLNAAIKAGEKDLAGKIAALNKALEDANAAYKLADDTLKSELTTAITDATATLDAAIKQLQANLDSTKAELEKEIADLEAEAQAKDKELSDRINALEEALNKANEALKKVEEKQAEAEKEGCGSSSAIAQVMLILGAALIIKKKK